ncbi:hypothetical protein SAMN05216276_100991 [Streptosporangium subroseum]|uniref:Uncharacterized protein n=2 Tax=Streptosporangium subroseum TaxID=106412 RepID=A0A239EDH7_9ACTN|nr:hypothetical protein SAMN05216276_100991 [Streptosporangium subroseum]
MQLLQERDPAGSGSTTAATSQTDNPDRSPADTSPPATSGTSSQADSTDQADPIDRATTAAGWRLTKDDEPLVIRPPGAEGDAFASCAASPSTFVELNNLTVITDSNHGSYVADGQTLEYMNCGENGTAPSSGIKLLDGQGIMGSVQKRNISPAECRDAARQANLPNPITIRQIQDDAVLKKNTGICVETSAKNVVLLWINRVDAHPDNHDLRTYLITATQWSPESS